MPPLELTTKQTIGIGVFGIGSLFVAYGLGWLDWIFTGGSPPIGGTPQSMTAGPGEVLCAGFNVFGHNQGRISVHAPDGSPAGNIAVYGACSPIGQTPTLSQFGYIGNTDGNGMSPPQLCGYNVAVNLYAKDPQNRWAPSNLVQICG